MSTTKTLTIIAPPAAQDEAAPAGVTGFLGYKCVLTNAAGSASESPVGMEMTWTFARPLPGDYTATMSYIGADGAAFGATLTASIPIPADPIQQVFFRPATGLSFVLN